MHGPRLLPVFALIAHLTACNSEGVGSGPPQTTSTAPPPDASSPPPRDSASPTSSTPQDMGPSSLGFEDGFMLETATPPEDAIDPPLYRDADIVLPASWSFACPASSEGDVSGAALLPSAALVLAYGDASCGAGATGAFVGACTKSTPGSFQAVRPFVTPSYVTTVPAQLVSVPVQVTSTARFYAVDINLSGAAPLTIPLGATRCLVAAGRRSCPDGYPTREALASVADSRAGSCSATVTQSSPRLEVHSTDDCSAAVLPIPLDVNRCTAFPSTNIGSADLRVHATTTVAPAVTSVGGTLAKAYFTACCISE